MDDADWIEKRELVIEAINDVKIDLAFVRLKLALRAFDLTQPRWPAGRPYGGEWRPVGGASGGRRFDVASRIKPSLLAQCEEQMESDKDACRASQSALCWSLVLPRYNACIHGDYIPELLPEVPE